MVEESSIEDLRQSKKNRVQAPTDAAPQQSNGKVTRPGHFAPGLWESSDMTCRYVAFLDGHQAKALLLQDWNGRPGFTVAPFDELVGKHVAEVAIVVTDVGNFVPKGAMVGKLRVKDDRAMITTVDEHGKMVLAPIAPLFSGGEDDGDYEYSWALARKDDIPPEVMVYYLGNGNDSWLNQWFSREYENEDKTCPFCVRELEMILPRSYVD
jgi:hypothetical protein